MPTSNPPLNLSFPSVETPSGYINRARDPSASSYLDAELWNHPEMPQRAWSSTVPPQSAIPSTALSPGRFHLRFLPW
jgi:hypothetical protein